MDKNTYRNLLEEAARHLNADCLTPAMDALDSLAASLADWDAASRLSDIRRAYSAMLNYFRTGAEDSGRGEMYSHFLRDADRVWCEFYRNYLITHTETAYAQTMRLRGHMENAPQPTDLMTNGGLSPRTLFETLWTALPLTQSVAALIRTFIENAEAGSTNRLVAASALTLSALEVFDPQKLRLLISLSDSEDLRLRTRALVGTALVFLTHQKRAARYPDLFLAARTVFEGSAARHELAEVQMQLLMSMETDRLARSLREEILPEMLKNTHGKMPQNAEDLSRLNAEMADLGLNPEWERDKRRNEVGKKIRHLIEMQQKGADIYLSSFAMLKGRFPFFRDAANWFVPYSSSHPDLGLTGERKEFADILAKYGMLCDSDKYSLSLLLGQMAESQFALLKSQLQAMMPDSNEMEEPETSFTIVLRTTLQDFYRFATLFPHRHTALNPFRHSLLFATQAPFEELIGSGESLHQIAAFAFDEGNYSVALPLIMQLVEAEPTARLWQMAGYCHQCSGSFEEAAAAYERSGLFGEQSTWTIRQLAACHRAAGHYEIALDYYEQMAASHPDDIALLLHRAQCLQESGRQEEALELLHKAAYLEETPAEGTRALAKALFQSRRFDNALSALRRILSAEPLPADRLLAAHAAWLSGDVGEAVALYKGYYSRLDPALRAEQQPADLLFADERTFLLQNGKTQVDLQIMADATAEKQV